MKKSLLLLLLVLGVSFLGFSQSAKKSKIDTLLLNSDIHCQNCIDKIEGDLPYMVKGLRTIDCNLEKKQIKVIYRNDKTSPELIKSAIKKLGYAAEEPKPAGKSACCSKSSTSKKCCSSTSKKH